MPKLTEEQKEAYINGKGMHCPYCGSDGGIDGAFVEIDGNEASQDIMCKECETSWTDVYTLTAIVEEE